MNIMQTVKPMVNEAKRSDFERGIQNTLINSTTIDSVHKSPKKTAIYSE